MATKKKGEEQQNEDPQYEYVITPRFAKRSTLVFINPDTKKHVNLIGEGFETMTSGSKKNPPKAINVLAATQADLKKFWELGSMEVGGELISNQKVVVRIPRQGASTQTTDENASSNQ